MHVSGSRLWSTSAGDEVGLLGVLAEVSRASSLGGLAGVLLAFGLGVAFGLGCGAGCVTHLCCTVVLHLGRAPQ